MSKKTKENKNPQTESEQKEQTAEAAESATETAEFAAETKEAAAEETESAEAELDPLEKLQQDFSRLSEEKNALSNQMLRLQADFDNFRKRTRAEKEEWRAMIVSGFCTDILPVLDNFRWAVQAMEKDESAKPHLAGVQMILKQLLDVMSSKGVTQIHALGEPFDPKFHDAIGQVEVDDESRVNKVVEEITAGYQIGDKVIRVARVKVGCRKKEESEEQTE